MDTQIYPEVEGKIVMITGAGRGIGRALAIAFAAQKASALLLAALEDDELKETESLVHAAHPPIVIFRRSVDMTDEAQVAAFVADGLASVSRADATPRLDVLCSNAGIAPPLQLLGTSTPDAWWRGLEVNLRGCYLAARQALPVMAAQGWGRILFTSSIAAGLVEPRNSSYQISKLAVTRLADCIDVEYRARGITAFAVHPGRVDTQLLRAIEGDGSSSSADSIGTRPSRLDSVAGMTTMCLFLCTPAAAFLGGRWVDATHTPEALLADQATIEEHDLLRAEVSTGWGAQGRIILPRTL